VNLRKDHYRDESITFERFKSLMPAFEQRKAVNHGVPVCSAFVGGKTSRCFDDHRLCGLETLKVFWVARAIDLTSRNMPSYALVALCS
jgi:hypothetical protein